MVGDARPLGLTANVWLGISGSVAGLLIALTAPVLGQRADAGGSRRRSLAVWSAAESPLPAAAIAFSNTVKMSSVSLPCAIAARAAGSSTRR